MLALGKYESTSGECLHRVRLAYHESETMFVVEEHSLPRAQTNFSARKELSCMYRNEVKVSLILAMARRYQIREVALSKSDSRAASSTLSLTK
jgi:hypothetical protein